MSFLWERAMLNTNLIVKDGKPISNFSDCLILQGIFCIYCLVTAVFFFQKKNE